jgi:hypothetical protein
MSNGETLVRVGHRELLRKYIAHVGVHEGVSLISADCFYCKHPSFTAEELSELRALEQEAKDL